MIDLDKDFNLVIEKPYPIYLGSLPWTSYDSVPADVIFNFCGDLPKKGASKTTFILPFFDVNSFQAIPSSSEIDNFLEVAYIYTNKGPTFWHCHAGANRSAFMLARYLWEAPLIDASMKDIIALIREKRGDFCLSNDAFYNYLMNLEQ